MVVVVVSSVVVVLPSVVVVVISIEDSKFVAVFGVVSSVLKDVSKPAELATSDDVSEVEPEVVLKAAEVVSVVSFDVVVRILDSSCSVDDDVSVIDPLDKMDDSKVTEDSAISEEIMVGVTKPNVWVREVDASKIWEETVVDAPKPKVEADELMAWEETVELSSLSDKEETVDDIEGSIDEDARADMSTIWDAVVVNASEREVLEKVPIGPVKLIELTSVDAAVSAIVGSLLLKIRELTVSAVLASVVIVKAEVEVSNPISRPFWHCVTAFKLAFRIVKVWAFSPW